MGDQIHTLGDQVSGLRSSLKDTKQQVEDERNETKIETARRQQAEKDQATLIQAVGKNTREGVVSDIKQSPISVHVDGSPAPVTPLRAPNLTLTYNPEPSTDRDAPYCQRIIIQAETAVDPLATVVFMSDEIKHISTLSPEAHMGGPIVNPQNHKRLDVYMASIGGGQKVVSPEHPAVIIVCSDRAFQPLSIAPAIVR